MSLTGCLSPFQYIFTVKLQLPPREHTAKITNTLFAQVDDKQSLELWRRALAADRQRKANLGSDKNSWLIGQEESSWPHLSHKKACTLDLGLNSSDHRDHRFISFSLDGVRPVGKPYRNFRDTDWYCIKLRSTLIVASSLTLIVHDSVLTANAID